VDVLALARVGSAAGVDHGLQLAAARQRRARHHPLHYILRVQPLVRHFARHDLVQQRAEGEYIYFVRVAALLEQFRAHVARRAAELLAPFVQVALCLRNYVVPRQPEVAQLGFEVVVQEHVVRLYVAVRDLGLVQELKAPRNLQRHFNLFIIAQLFTRS